MPNRKKAAGKARKEKNSGGQRGWDFDPMRSSSGCRHGALPLDRGQISYAFLQEFDFNTKENLVNLRVRHSSSPSTGLLECVRKASDDAKAKFPSIMTDDDQRQIVRGHMLAMAANAILGTGTGTEDVAIAYVATSMSFTVFGVDEDSPSAVATGQPIMLCGARDVVKHLHHRIPCRCLNARYKELRKQPSVAPCFYCGKVTERKKLLVCSRCRCDNYCSRECQKQAWPQHKLKCKKRSEGPAVPTATGSMKVNTMWSQNTGGYPR